MKKTSLSGLEEVILEGSTISHFISVWDVQT